MIKRRKVFVPSRGFLFFYSLIRGYNDGRLAVFVPSRGFLFFYQEQPWTLLWQDLLFSSPHGDFSFSIQHRRDAWSCEKLFSSPHGDFSFSIRSEWAGQRRILSFRPLTGISLFLYSSLFVISHIILFSSPHGDFSFSMVTSLCPADRVQITFSSPHGDFSFSIDNGWRTGNSALVFVPSRGFLFFYQWSQYAPWFCSRFRPLTGISLFL